MRVNKLIFEEIKRFLKEEYNEDVMFSLYDAHDRMIDNIFRTFLYENNADMSRAIPWTVIPFYRIKKIWEDYGRTNLVRDTKGLELIEKIIMRNILKIWCATELQGHTQSSMEDEFEDNIGYFIDNYFEAENKVQPQYQFLNVCYSEIADEYEDDTTGLRQTLFEKLQHKLWYDFFAKGYCTDYGLQPLQRLLIDMAHENNPEKKLIVIDKILNVVHQTSDLAAWFIEGGSRSLSDISGYGNEDGDSKISGRYRMGDYK